ncbi:MAG TPA: heavy metal sensor histidine kinase [Oscillatoriaceae cyanobacterium]
MNPRATGNWSLALRLTIVCAVSAFGVVLVVTGLLYSALSQNLYREDREALRSKIALLRDLRQQHPTDRSAIAQEVVWEATSDDPHVFVRLIRPDGRMLLETPGMTNVLPPTAFTKLPASRATRMEALPPVQGHSYLIATALNLADDDHVRIQAAIDRTQESALLARFRGRLWWVLSIALLACTALGYLVARAGVQPLRSMATRLDRIGSQSLDVRLSTTELPAEVAVLAEAFNAMLERLDASFARLSRFSADLAHELRTPLNNLLGETEVALSRPRSPVEYQAVLASCREEYERLASLIDSLLFLARAEGRPVPPARERLDLAKELQALQEYYEAAASEAGVALELVPCDGVAIEIDRTLFQRALGNLITNALRYTPAGGRVRLAATANEHEVAISVADTGCGIAAEHLPHVFERFYRADAARSNAQGGNVGLGLAIVKGIAELYRGSVSIESAAGEGTRATVRVPRASHVTPVE